MKKRILALLLCTLLLAAPFVMGTGASAAGALTFIAINDTLPPDLINVLAYYGGSPYVPYWLLTGYGFGVNYSYFPSSSTAYLYNSRNQIFFELVSGETYNSDGVQYAAPAVMIAGTVYFPLGFVCSAFGGFTYRSIGSNEYGSILRITTGAEVLDDGDFFQAAQGAMKRYYLAYNSAVPTQTPEPTATVAPVETPEPTAPVETPDPDPELEPEPTDPPREGDILRLGLEGMPSEETLELLRQQDITVCFFLRAEEIAADPDMVRRIACAGHSLGVSCPDGDVETQKQTAALLWETARVRTVLFALPEGAVTLDGAAAFTGTGADWTADTLWEGVYIASSRLEIRGGDQTLIFPCGDGDTAALKMLLYYLDDQGFTLAPLREVDSGDTPILPR